MAIATINPATNEVVKTFAALTEAQVDEKIDKAAKTFQSYRIVPGGCAKPVTFLTPKRKPSAV